MRIPPLIAGQVGAACLALALLWLGWLGSLLAVLGGWLIWQAAGGGTADGVRIFGPTLGWELRRIVRRPRVWSFRTGFVLLLAVSAGVVFVDVFETPGLVAQAAVGRKLANWWIWGQGFALVWLAQTLFGDWIEQERTNGNWEACVLTDLTAHELLLSKWLARVAVLGLVWLAAWPLWLGLALIGGISWTGLLVVQVNTVVVVLGWVMLIGLGDAQNPNQVGQRLIGWTFMGLMFAWLFGTKVLNTFAGWGLIGPSEPVYRGLLAVLNLGNPFELPPLLKTLAIDNQPPWSAGLSVSLPVVQFYGLLSIWCLTLTLIHFSLEPRAEASAEPELPLVLAVVPTAEVTPSAAQPGWFDREVLPIGDAPLWWYACRVQGVGVSSRFARLVEAILSGGLWLIAVVGLVLAVRTNQRLTHIAVAGEAGFMIGIVWLWHWLAIQGRFSVLRFRQIVGDLLRTPSDEQELAEQIAWCSLYTLPSALRWLAWWLLAALLIAPLTVLPLLPVFVAALVQTSGFVARSLREVLEQVSWPQQLWRVTCLFVMTVGIPLAVAGLVFLAAPWWLIGLVAGIWPPGAVTVLLLSFANDAITWLDWLVLGSSACVTAALNLAYARYEWRRAGPTLAAQRERLCREEA
jgi:hypothetical protein